MNAVPPTSRTTRPTQPTAKPAVDYARPKDPAAAANRRAGWRALGRDLAIVTFWYVVSATALAWIFPPYGLWPLALVCLVPWAVVTCRTQRAWLVHWLNFIVGWGFFLVTLRWLMPVTGLGYAALALYLALYWTLAGWALRTARRHGISPLWTLPVVWVACEFLRGTVMSGFPWLFVAHGLYAQTYLTQIADLGSAYAVSFLALLVNGVLAECALQRWPIPGVPRNRRQLVAGGIVTVVLIAATLGYSRYRIAQYDQAAGAIRQGPRVAVVQHDFPLVSKPPYGAHPYLILASYLSLAAEAAQEDPDLIVFPETVWSASQNLSFIETERAALDSVHADMWAFSKLCHEAVAAFARGDYPAANVQISRLDALVPDAELPRLPADGGPPVTVLVGSVSLEQFPDATYPKIKRFNSALAYDADGTQRRIRYDKIHLVPFGEFVPFRQAKVFGIDLHWLYRWLNSLSPFSDGGRIEYSLTPGTDYTTFELPTATGVYEFGVPICYEDTVPYVGRRFVWDGAARRVDFLVNISNDGWFQHSVELPQHLAICTFRAIENRVSIARAVNTGISGFIDPNGRVVSRVTDDTGRSFGPGVVGYDIMSIPLDQRGSLYGRTGDWLAWICVALTVALWLAGVFERWVLALQQRIRLLFASRGE
jgi:apolipoprotein N-acyltransferase